MENQAHIRFSDGTTKPVVGHTPDPENPGIHIPLVPDGSRAVPATSFDMSYTYLNEGEDPGSENQLILG